MANVVEQAKAEIRFALSQLAARNGQFEFETMTRMLARATVTRNVLIATGPVASGGDQGRDFETYRTDLAGQTQPLGRKIGISDNDGVGFACTLQQDDIGTKIRRDVGKIMASGRAVTFILAYCEVNIPVARRHELQEQVRDAHDVHLEVFDGAGISELLAHHATFWIAEQYLHLPGRTLPPPPDRPDWYEADLARWRQSPTAAWSWGDHVDLTVCLCYAYQQREGREDIPFWLEKLASLMADDVPASLRHATRHQVILAHHLGLGSMRPVDELTTAEITDAAVSRDVHLIADAAVLLLLTCAAFARDETGHSADRIMSWNAQLTTHVTELLAADTYPGERCSLLETLAALKMQPDLTRAGPGGRDYRLGGATTDLTVDERMQEIADYGLTPAQIPAVDLPGVLDAIAHLAETLPDAPMYPIEPVNRFLTLHMPLLMDDRRYETIADVFDGLLADTVGDAAAADQALERANTFFAAGRVLDALRLLHRALARLIRGDSGARLVHATLATAEAYQQLHLYAAAKYYGLLAAGLTRRDDPDLFPQGLFKAAAAEYQQGNWASATRLNHRALTAHALMAERAGEVDRYPWVSDAALELVTIKALADKLEPAVTNLVGHAVTDPRIRGLFDMATAALTSAGPPWWDGWDVTRHATRIADRLGIAPFADTTGLRRIRFACLGVDWTIEFANSAADVVVGERLAAALQIILAYLAAADPALLPTRVTVHVAAGPPGAAATIEENGSVRGETRFRCMLAAVTGNRREAAQIVAQQTLTAVNTVILTVSTLSDARWDDLITKSGHDDLISMICFAYAYDTVHGDLGCDRDIDPALTDRQLLPADVTAFPEPGPGLEFPQAPGPGYTEADSHAGIRSKYEDLPARMLPTLTGLRRDPAFAATVAALREQGWRDWHILFATHNLAKSVRMTHRAPHLVDDFAGARDFFLGPEPDNDPVPPRFFTSDALRHTLDVSVAASARSIWKLTLRQPIDLAAVRHLLTVRYRWNADDVAHDDPFLPPGRD
ncbi:hypothetical protein ACIBVK_30260 [Micromonospora echinofusca]|uniref:hypothetical protein n=1 Tax=Micromonospora echinofusca TaxID=47858 RepID=UPI0037A75B31